MFMQVNGNLYVASFFLKKKSKSVIFIVESSKKWSQKSCSSFWPFDFLSIRRYLALVNVWGKRFKLPQLTHESVLTIDHSCKIFFWYLPNWTSTDLWSRTVLHTRGWWKFNLADIKKMFCRSHQWSKSSHVVVVAAWNVFPILSLMGTK